MENSIYIISEALKNYIAKDSTLLESDINLQMPKKQWVDLPSSTNPKANIYLFDIKENVELRNNEWKTLRKSNGTVQRQKPEVRVDLYYLVTFYSQELEPDKSIKEEQQWLSEVLAIVHTHDNIPKECFVNENGNALLGIPDIPITTIRPKYLEGEGGVQLWSTIDQYLRPAIYLKVTAPIKLAKQIEETMVFLRLFKYGQPDDTNYYKLSLYPSIQNDYAEDNASFSQILPSTIAVYSQFTVKKGNNQIEVDNSNTIYKNNILKISDGIYTEFCKVKHIVNNTITLESELLFDHSAGVELRKIEDIIPISRLQIKLIEPVSHGLNKLIITGKDVADLKNGCLIQLSNNQTNEKEYLQITKIEQNTININISDSLIDFSGIVTNNTANPAPIAGAIVGLYAVRGGDQLIDKANTNERGQFIFRNIKNQRYKIKVNAQEQGYKSDERIYEDLLKIKNEDYIIKLDVIT